MRSAPPSRLFVVQTDQAHSHLSSGIDDVDYIPSRSVRIGCTVSAMRVRGALIFFFLCLSVFLIQAASVQIIQGSHYRRLAEDNRFRTHQLLSERGMIFDRNGVVLTRNVPSFALIMTIVDLPKQRAERLYLFEEVSRLTGLQPTDLDLLATQYASSPRDPIPVKRNLAYEPAMHLAIQSKNLPGFRLQIESVRHYPQSVPSLSHVLGYTGRLSAEELFSQDGYKPIDTIGKTGIERYAETILRGEPGELVMEVDARGRELAMVSQSDPVAGSHITLTLDAVFQKFVEEALQATLKATHTSKGSVIAMDPETGEIYTMVSLPTYDNNLFAQGIDQQSFAHLIEDPDQPLFFRAVSGEFPSGSTFKPFVAYAALAEGIVNEHTSFVSTGGVRVGDWFFPDWKSGGHGVTDVRKAIAESVNTYFYIIGGGLDSFNGLGVDRITQYAARFAFGQKTGIDLPSEADGFLPSKTWKEQVKGERWYVGDTYHLAIGQGDFLTTPLQMARAISTMANGGKHIVPHLVMSGQTSEKETISSLNADALRIVREGMRQAVTRGSAPSLLDLPVSVAGKTGTAQAPGTERFHSWFTGFAPFDRPEVAVVVLIEEGGESTDAAVPLAKQILAYWFER